MSYKIIKQGKKWALFEVPTKLQVFQREDKLINHFKTLEQAQNAVKELLDKQAILSTAHKFPAFTKVRKGVLE